MPADLMLQVLEAIPARWHRYSPTAQLLARLGQVVSPADARYLALCKRQYRQGNAP